MTRKLHHSKEKMENRCSPFHRIVTEFHFSSFPFHIPAVSRKSSQFLVALKGFPLKVSHWTSQYLQTLLHCSVTTSPVLKDGHRDNKQNHPHRQLKATWTTSSRSSLPVFKPLQKTDLFTLAFDTL